MFIIDSKHKFICLIIRLKVGELGTRLLIIQKRFIQSCKLLVKLTVLVTDSYVFC